MMEESDNFVWGFFSPFFLNYFIIIDKNEWNYFIFFTDINNIENVVKRNAFEAGSFDVGTK